MKMLKSIARTAKSNKGVLLATGAALVAVAVPDLAMAADYDTTEVVAAVGQAEVAGMSVGTKVVAAVASFVVIGIIIAMVKKA